MKGKSIFSPPHANPPPSLSLSIKDTLTCFHFSEDISSDYIPISCSNDIFLTNKTMSVS